MKGKYAANAPESVMEPWMAALSINIFYSEVFGD